MPALPHCVGWSLPRGCAGLPRPIPDVPAPASTPPHPGKTTWFKNPFNIFNYCCIFSPAFCLRMTHLWAAALCTSPGLGWLLVSPQAGGGRGSCWKKSCHELWSCSPALTMPVLRAGRHTAASLGTRTSVGVGPLRLSPILSALLSLLGIIKENGCFPEPGPGPSALPALSKSPCNKFIGITLPSPNPGPSPRVGDLKGLEPGR